MAVGGGWGWLLVAVGGGCWWLLGVVSVCGGFVGSCS